ncbi:MAG: thioesterase [Cyclobacteriaceae bacterium]
MSEYTLSTKQEKFRKKMLNPFFFRLFTMSQVPAGAIAGMKLTKLDTEQCQTTLPFKFLNKNPFKSIYFAVQSMAAELSTASLALLAITDKKPSVAFIIVDLEAKFMKKAIGKVTFTCVDGPEVFRAVEECIATGESRAVRMRTVGKLKDGTEVSEFFFTWSFKQRKK